jgi:hypothetical protein
MTTKEQVLNSCEIILNNGHKHIQFGWCGCIKMMSNENGVYYATRNGKGTGVNNGVFSSLSDCIDNVIGCGWYNSDTQITFK